MSKNYFKMHRFLFFLLPVVIYSQDLPIQPEETPYLLKPGQFQVETALSYRKENAIDKTIVLPNSLLKIGIISIIEFRIIYEQQFLNNSISGTLPIMAGLKTKLWKEKKGLPEASIIIQTSIPKLASNNFKQDNFAPELQLQLQGNYSDSFSINYNVGTKWDGFNKQPFFTHKTTATYSINKNWYVYAEVFGHQHVFEPSHISYNNGLMYQINNNMILDFSGGFGLNKAAPNYFGAVIFSFRI